MKHLTTTFLRGLAALVPIVLTIYLLYWLATTSEEVLGKLFKLILPDALYRPGLGLAAGVVITFLMGLAMRLYVGRAVLRILERAVLSIPGVKTIYGGIKDFAGFMAQSSQQKTAGRVVRVRIAENVEVLGFVTRTDFSGFPINLAHEGWVAVYLPMSYQIGGYTVLVPKHCIEQIDMDADHALRFVVTAGMSTA